MHQVVDLVFIATIITTLFVGANLHPHSEFISNNSGGDDGTDLAQKPCLCPSGDIELPECCILHSDHLLFSEDGNTMELLSVKIPETQMNASIHQKEVADDGMVNDPAQDSMGSTLNEQKQLQKFSLDKTDEPQGEENSKEHGEPLLEHGCRHNYKLSEDEQETLENTLLLIEELQRFPNSSSRVRVARQAHLTAIEPVCEAQKRFRTTDGTCNHPKYPLRGAASQASKRLAAPTYQDGVFLPRFLDSAGRMLPSPRQVSLSATSQKKVLASRLTDSVMQWGQFLDHDLALAPEVKPKRPCCHDGRTDGGASPFCLPITMKIDDPVYAKCKQTCMKFIRSVPAWDPKLQVLTPLNARTSFIDADMIYGVGSHWMSSLRAPHGRSGLQIHGKKFLLPDFAPAMDCFSALSSEPCFKSGDHRVNVQVRLTVTHTVWMREHNRVAEQLELQNPHWTGERIFEEARRVVIAEVQHITYKEWLPIVLGEEFTKSYRIDVDTRHHGNYSHRYNEDTDSTISTEFATAAFRFGHSLISDDIHLFSNVRGGPFGFTLLQDMFFNPHLIYQGALDMLAKSLVVQKPQVCDANFARVLTGHLFQKPGDECGLDLIAINIQRGRDHGIPTYTQMMRWCGLPVPETFHQLMNFIPSEVIIRLAGIYRTVADIDLFIGGVAERPVSGAVVGPTFQCILGDQFFRLRWGDNYFYDLGGEERLWRFTPDQLQQLRRVTWSKILCDNVGTMRWVQPNAFLAASEENPVKSCMELPDIDFSLWKSNT